MGKLRESCWRTERKEQAFTSTSTASFFWNSWMDRLSGGVLRKENIQDNELSNQLSRHWQVDLYMWCCGFYIWHLLVKRKSSKALASSGHMVSNFPDEACWRATGSPMDSTLSRDDTASFHVLSDGQAYFKPKGILKVWRMNKRKRQQ